MQVEITVLTCPVPTGYHRISDTIKQMAVSIRNMVKPQPGYMRSKYKGHFAVTRSLVEGLQKARIRSNYNPLRASEIGKVVVVLSGLSALRQAIGWKRAGAVQTLIAGPNLVDFPSDAKDLICAPEVDLCITPGPLTCKLYVEDCPELRGRCAAWPAGVDSLYWSPSREMRDRQLILFYDKPTQWPTDNLELYVNHARNRGYNVETIRYGRYSREQYRNLLRQSGLMVCFTAAESQGIAWAEAWSSDVPTLHWWKDRHSFNHPRSRGRLFETSTAPYLTDATGRFFRDIEGFKGVFEDWKSNRIQCNPRFWILENMSDEVCARRLCELAGI